MLLPLRPLRSARMGSCRSSTNHQALINNREDLGSRMFVRTPPWTCSTWKDAYGEVTLPWLECVSYVSPSQIAYLPALSNAPSYRSQQSENVCCASRDCVLADCSLAVNVLAAPTSASHLLPKQHDCNRPTSFVCFTVSLSLVVRSHVDQRHEGREGKHIPRYIIIPMTF